MSSESTTVVCGYPVGEVIAAAVAVVLVRLVWVLAVAPPLVRGTRQLTDRTDPGTLLPWREGVVLGWCGPRGAASLAVALSLPLTTEGGAPFLRRDLLVFLTMVVVLVTLVEQILPLVALLGRLQMRPGPDRTS